MFKAEQEYLNSMVFGKQNLNFELINSNYSENSLNELFDVLHFKFIMNFVSIDSMVNVKI